MSFIELLDRIVSLIFPPRCIICQDIVEYDSIICGKCLYNKNTCDVDEKVLASGASGAASVMVYDEAAANALISYKHYGDKRATVFFSGEILKLIVSKWGNTSFDIVTPVPMSKRSRKERGFNQAELLARSIADLLGTNLRTDMLLRTPGSFPQHRLSRDERVDNAERSYLAGNITEAYGKNILLVDDIITTGATARACSGLLLKAGAASVYVAAVASSKFSQE